LAIYSSENIDDVVLLDALRFDDLVGVANIGQVAVVAVTGRARVEDSSVVVVPGPRGRGCVLNGGKGVEGGGREREEAHRRQRARMMGWGGRPGPE
jgi:hypothetical protein